MVAMVKSPLSKSQVQSDGRPAKDEADLSFDHRLPAILLFQCIECGHVDMVEWPESDEEA